MDFIRQPAPSGRLGDHLKHQLAEGQWTRFRAAVALVKRSGTRHIMAQLSAFAQYGEVEFIVGVDHGGTSHEGLRDLLDAVAPHGRVLVFHNPLPFTFHPKVYLFSNRTAAHVLIGSGNLTEGGLFTNYEGGLSLALDLTNPDEAAVFASIDQGFDSWTDLSVGTALALNDELLAKWSESGLVPSETSSPSSVDSVPDDHAKRSGPLRSAGNVGDNLRMERAERSNECEYIVEVIAKDTDRHRIYLSLCRHPVRNSEKRYGYY